MNKWGWAKWKKTKYTLLERKRAKKIKMRNSGNAYEKQIKWQKRFSLSYCWLFRIMDITFAYTEQMHCVILQRAVWGEREDTGTGRTTRKKSCYPHILFILFLVQYYNRKLQWNVIDFVLHKWVGRKLREKNTPKIENSRKLKIVTQNNINMFHTFSWSIPKVQSRIWTCGWWLRQLSTPFICQRKHLYPSIAIKYAWCMVNEIKMSILKFGILKTAPNLFIYPSRWCYWNSDPHWSTLHPTISLWK